MATPDLCPNCVGGLIERNGLYVTCDVCDGTPSAKERARLAETDAPKPKAKRKRKPRAKADELKHVKIEVKK